MGTWQVTALGDGALEPCGQIAGPAIQIHAVSGPGEMGGIWLVWLVPGDLLVLTGGGDLSGEIQEPGTSREHKTVSDTPGQFRRSRCWSRYGWSWPEPPAGATPHQHRVPPRALGKTGTCGQLGSRTADRMAVPQSPSIRERACPARLGPA